MARKLWDWQVFEPLAASYADRIVRLSGESLALFLSTEELTEIDRWQSGTELPTPTEQDDIEALVAQAYEELMVNPLLGTIFPYVTTLPPEGAIVCDGGTYLRTDFPELYAVLDSAFIVDADHFTTPDLYGRTIVGLGAGAGLTSRAMNDQGGEETHQLTTAELASHSHGITDAGHIHGEGIAAPSIGAAITGVPVPSAVPAVGATALASTGIVVNAAGADTPHENMPPFTVLGYAIWAI